MSATDKVRKYLWGRLTSTHPALSFIESYVDERGTEHDLTTHMLDDLVAENEELRRKIDELRGDLSRARKARTW